VTAAVIENSSFCVQRNLIFCFVFCCGTAKEKDEKEKETAKEKDEKE
jgi:hypothetical protein